MSKRKIIIHCHIFKNAGSTIDNILKNNFGSSAITQETNDGNFLSLSTILAIAQNKNINAISSHKLGLPAPLHPTIEFIPLIMLREPLDRLKSMYSFYYRQRQKINYECVLAQQTTFRDFVKILLESGLDKSFVNIQSQFFLANCTPTKFPSDSTWNALVETFNSIKCVGVVERFNDSLTLWEKYLQYYFPLLNCAYIRKNVSIDRKKDISERIYRIKNELGPELTLEFEKRNKIDYRLYQLANKRLDADISNTCDFMVRKKNLALRVKKLERSISYEVVDDTTLTSCRKTNDRRNTSIQAGKYKLVEISSKEDLFPSKSIQIVGCGLFDYVTEEHLTIVLHGQKVKVIILVKANKQVNLPIIGITIKSSNADIMFAMNSYFEKEKLDTPEIGLLQLYSFSFNIPPLNSGIYSITPKFVSGSQNDNVPLSCIDDAIVFVVPVMIPQRLPGALYVNEFQLKSVKIAPLEYS